MAAGYYLALAGGVLNNGYSDNDLDLVAVPRTEDSNHMKLIITVLPKLLGGDVTEISNVACAKVMSFKLSDTRKVDISIITPRKE